MKKNIWVGLMIIFIVGCSGSPKLETQYYLLTPSPQNKTVVNEKLDNEKSKKIIEIDSIKIAEYLDQPGIVLHTGKHQIEVAHYHRWAEPLKLNLHRFILETLSSKNTNYTFQANSKLTKNDSALILIIEVSNFNGSSTGETILAGRWMLENSKSGELMGSESFHYQHALKQDGYNEMVSQLALSLETLCDEIFTSISTLQ
jgi:uncharacterized lipoprotein YmbA